MEQMEHAREKRRKQTVLTDTYRASTEKQEKKGEIETENV